MSLAPITPAEVPATSVSSNPDPGTTHFHGNDRLAFRAYETYSQAGQQHSNWSAFGTSQPPSSSRRRLVAPLPDEHFAYMACLTEAHLRRLAQVSNETHSVFKGLRLRQQIATRHLPSKHDGNFPYDYTTAADIENWNTRYSSTVAPDEDENTYLDGPFGGGPLDDKLAGLVKTRDGAHCATCPETEDLEAAHLVSRTKASWAGDSVIWLRSTDIDRTFRKDLPSNILSLCPKHHKSYDKYGWCLVPSIPDMEALIAFEMMDVRQRVEEYARRRLTNPQATFPPRTVPPPYMLSGWYEFLPLSYRANSYWAGHYRVSMRKNVIIATESQGGSAYEERSAVEISYITTASADANSEDSDSGDEEASCFYNPSTGTMWLWLGLSDLNSHAVITSANYALSRDRHPLTPRTDLIKLYLRILHMMYRRNPMIKTDPAPGLRALDPAFEAKEDPTAYRSHDSDEVDRQEAEESRAAAAAKTLWNSLEEMMERTESSNADTSSVQNTPVGTAEEDPANKLMFDGVLAALRDPALERVRACFKGKLTDPLLVTGPAATAYLLDMPIAPVLPFGLHPFQRWLAQASVEAKIARENFEASLDRSLRGRIKPGSKELHLPEMNYGSDDEKAKRDADDFEEDDLEPGLDQPQPKKARTSTSSQVGPTVTGGKHKGKGKAKPKSRAKPKRGKPKKGEYRPKPVTHALHAGDAGHPTLPAGPSSENLTEDYAPVVGMLNQNPRQAAVEASRRIENLSRTHRKAAGVGDGEEEETESEVQADGSSDEYVE